MSRGTTNEVLEPCQAGVPCSCFCWFSLRPAAPFKGDSPRASLRGLLISSMSSTGKGRLGELVACKYSGRGLLLPSWAYGGRGLWFIDGICGCSIDCMMFLGRICAAGEMISRTAVGSKPSALNREANRESLGSSGNNSPMRCSNLLI